MVTAMPAAILARAAASKSPLPDASASARAATTVSPAPETSNTSRGRAVIWVICPPRSITERPAAPRVIITAERCGRPASSRCACVTFRFAASGVRRFLLVGRDHGRAVIMAKRRALGIDNHRLALFPAKRDQPLHQGGRQKSLGIIRDHQHVMIADRLARRGENPAGLTTAPMSFVVGAHHLLLVGDVADLIGGPSTIRRHQGV